MKELTKKLQESKDSVGSKEFHSNAIESREIDENEDYFGWDLTWEKASKDAFPSAYEFWVASKIFRYAISESDDIWENAEEDPRDWDFHSLDPMDEELDDLIPGEDEYPEQDPKILSLKKDLNKNFSSALQSYQVFRRHGRIDEDITVYELVYFWWTESDYSLLRFREKVLH